VILLPETDHEWQHLVDACEGALALDAARKYGLVWGGPKVNVDRCLELLLAGAARGYHPREDAPEHFVHELLSEQPVPL
jgi:hypothetical protein